MCASSRIRSRPRLAPAAEMSYILALFLPFLAVMLKGRVLVGIVLLVLQVTLIGWLPATIVAFFIIHQENTKQAIREAMDRRD